MTGWGKGYICRLGAVLALSFGFFGSFVSVYAIDDNTHYTTVGNISLTVTNYGIFGTGFSTENQPSCEYPYGSNVEHMWYGGLWFGGEQNGVRKVSTGAIDRYPGSGVLEGYEFTNRDEPNDIKRIVEKSSLINSRYYDPTAISHQDFICDYTDSNRSVPQTGDTIILHEPFKIIVHQETYAWSMPFADAFVILRFDITNASGSVADSIYNIWAGFWYEPTIGNTDLTPFSGPNARWNWYDDACNFLDTLAMGYKFDYDGDNGFAESYSGLRFLGSDPAFFRDDHGQQHLYTDSGIVKYNIWKWNNRQGQEFTAPANDFERYNRLSSGLNDFPTWRQTPGVLAPNNWVMLISTGPFPTLHKDSTMQVVFAIVCGRKYGTDPVNQDTWAAKTNLVKSAHWAKIAYDGEDKNGNGILDPGEDLPGPNGEPPNGVIDRYRLPVPPPSPVMKLAASSNEVDIYWNNFPESVIDPVLGRVDFEGYRIYRARITQDNQGQGLRDLLELIGEFDIIDSIGYNTGMGYIALPEPVVIDGDTMYYKFVCDNLLDGWQYAFAVTAFDTGDPVNNLESLESSPLLNATRVIPGSTPSAKAKVGVFPNPYRAWALWDGRGADGPKERLRKLHFFNLPEKCTITIYTLAGEIVDRIDHDAANYGGEDIAWYQNYAGEDVVFSGGFHSWDIVSESDQALASGMYLYSVKDEVSGDIQRGKFIIIK